jgi:hypothetical protein
MQTTIEQDFARLRRPLTDCRARRWENFLSENPGDDVHELRRVFERRERLEDMRADLLEAAQLVELPEEMSAVVYEFNRANLPIADPVPFGSYRSSSAATTRR